MTMLRRTIVRVSVFALLCVLAMVAGLHIRQRFLRSRAEHLLRDIKQLELRKSNWDDAQRIFTRWGAWGHYDDLCVSSSCNYRIEFDNTFAKWPRLTPWVHRAYDFVGVRMGMVSANVAVRDGLVWGKGFGLYVESPLKSGTNASLSVRYTLIGISESASRLFISSRRARQLALHPEYIVTEPSGCTMCEAVFVRFTPWADPSDVARLMDFNLTCLTSRKPCREQGDIMPSAWRQHLAETKDTGD